MTSNNDDTERNNRGNLAVVRGGQYGKGRITLTKAEHRLDQQMQEAFAAIYGEAGTVPSRGIYDVREGVRQPWRTLARRIREAHAKGAPMESVKAPLLTFLRWIERDLYRITDDFDTAA